MRFVITKWEGSGGLTNDARGGKIQNINLRLQTLLVGFPGN